jgi:small subunit ribosomal protein S17
VSRIIAPFGEPIEARPPVPTFEERIEERERRRAEKEARREARRREAEALREGELVDGRERDAAVREAREAEVA